MFRTSPTLQSKPREIFDFSALIGGQRFPIADTLSRGSITALAYGTDRSNIKFNVEPHRS